MHFLKALYLKENLLQTSETLCEHYPSGLIVGKASGQNLKKRFFQQPIVLHRLLSNRHIKKSYSSAKSQ